MKRYRHLLLGLGITAGLVGLGLLVVPTPQSRLWFTGYRRTLPFVVLGLVMILCGVRYVFTAPDTQVTTETIGPSDTQYPDPARRPPYPSPGDQFVEQLAAVSWVDRRDEAPATRRSLRTTLREMAVAVLSRTEGWTRQECEQRLADGSWTDNAEAGAFFRDGLVPSLPVRHHLRSLWSPTPPFARRAQQVVVELCDRDAGTDVAVTTVPSAERPVEPRFVRTRQYWSPADPDTSTLSRSAMPRLLSVAGLLAGGLGVITVRPALLLLALFGVSVSGYARIVSPPAGSIDISRSVSTTDPEPGASVSVTVSVRNSGARTILDLRLIDGVPAGCTVHSGSPRFTTVLRPGNEATFEYSVRAVAGTHDFDPPLCIVRDGLGICKRESLDSGLSTTITCDPPSVPQTDRRHRRRTTIHSGHSPSTDSGSGIEFHSVRDYRHGDPPARIHWKQTAKTGALTTIEFRDARLTTVLIVVDARVDAYVSPPGSDRPILRQGLRATRSISAQLLSRSTPVGLVALSPESCWLTPRTGDAHRTQIQQTLAADPAFSWVPPETGGGIDSTVTTIRQRVADSTQLLFVTPLCDDAVTRAIRELSASGYDVSLISPDPTGSDTARMDLPCGYAALARSVRIDALSRAGIAVCDWDPDQPFEQVYTHGW